MLYALILYGSLMVVQQQVLNPATINGSWPRPVLDGHAVQLGQSKPNTSVNEIYLTNMYP